MFTRKSTSSSPFASLIAQNVPHSSTSSLVSCNISSNLKEKLLLPTKALKLCVNNNIFDDSVYLQINNELNYAKHVISQNKRNSEVFLCQKNASIVAEKIDKQLSFILQSIRGGCWFYEAYPKLLHFLATEKIELDDNRNEYLFYSMIKHFVTDFKIPPQDISNQDKYCYSLANFSFILFFHAAQQFPDILLLLWACMVIRFPILLGDYGSYRFDRNITIAYKYCLIQDEKGIVSDELVLQDMMHFKVSCLIFSYFLRISCHNVWYYMRVSEEILNCWGSPRIWITITRIINQCFPIHYLNCEILCDLLTYCSQPLLNIYGHYFSKLLHCVTKIYFP
ncbi:hypothetical protein MXB_123, partial [Myxobolus squamalis]